MAVIIASLLYLTTLINVLLHPSTAVAEGEHARGGGDRTYNTFNTYMFAVLPS
jgi:hypothetical protein